MNNARSRCIEQGRSEVQDCLVVGGGINGAVAAAALSGKGAKVTIVDKGDFAAFTSQESSNLAWGGIKYLETLEFGLVWKLCKSRNQLMRVYPNQVEETRFFTSISKGFRMPFYMVYVGALIYWVMGRFQTRPPFLLTRNAIRRRAPMLKAGQLGGGLEYSDCRLVENDSRFTFGFVRKTLDHGGSAINYMELVAAEWRAGLWHCALQDRVSGNAVEIKARSLVNAAGPFADGINQMLGIESSFRHVFSKGVHIIVPQICKESRVLTFFASDGRLFFMIPMGSRTCIGTTDTWVDSEAVEATAEDLDFLLENANSLLDFERPLTKADIIATRCGVRPLAVEAGASVNEGEWTALSRKHEIDLHPDRKMLTIYGGKITDCINVGNEIAGFVNSFGIELPKPAAVWFGEPETARGEGVPPELWRRYGEAAFQIVEKIEADPAKGRLLIEDYTCAELHHVAETEMVVHLEDFLRRRSMIALSVKPEVLRKAEGLGEVADILFGEHAVDELDRYFSKEPEVHV
ncbi:MAG: FAD-dependent oxidoreductase [Verrucomicrobia bacterium]|nr:MAG: FAD-dependent oxidoreductase [Verrucomicrobiota bacterium]